MTTTETHGPAHAAPRIDPRIRRRRVEVKRDEGRRRLRVLLTAIGCVLAVAAVIGLVHSPLLTVSSVSVVGARATDPTAIVQVARLDSHPLMVEVRPAAIDRRVAALPWVKTVKTERHWPQTVRIVVTERVAVAQLEAGDAQWALTDEAGRVLDIGPKQPDLPVLAGIAAPGPPGAVLHAPEALTVARALPPDLRSRVKDVAVVSDGIDLALLPRGTAHLGGIDRLGEKLTAAATVLARVDPKNLAVLDVRVPEAPVVTRGP